MLTQLTPEKYSPLPILKPWGWEVEIWKSIRLGITYLSIDSGKSTSLHCHPNKRTGYIVLKGDVEVEFLAGTKLYKAGDKVNFRPSLFHRSRAVAGDVVLLELESPPDKHDLVRLEDSNKRATSEYEKINATISDLNASILQSVSESLRKTDSGGKVIDGLAASMAMSSATPREILDRYENRVIVSPVDLPILTKRRHNGSGFEAIVQPGDVTTVGDLRRMSKILDLDTVISIFLVDFGTTPAGDGTR